MADLTAKGAGLEGFFSPTDSSRILELENHIHKRAITFVPDADGTAPISLSTTNSAWSDHSNMIAEIMSAGAMSTLLLPLGSKFDIHWAIISNISGNGNFEMKVYSGAAGSEVIIAHVPFVRNAVTSQEGAIPLQTPRIATATRISASIVSDQAAVRTCDVKFVGHVYD
jgi:hypothetical protein